MEKNTMALHGSIRRIISMVLVFIAVLNLIPAAYADDRCEYSAVGSDGEYIEVIKDNAPVRSGPAEKNEVLERCSSGTTLEVDDTHYNRYFHKWYKVSYNGVQGYIYSGNVTEHTHCFRSYTDGDITYKYCDCGKINVVVTEEVEVKKAMDVATAAAAAASLSDGPFPAGEAIGLTIIAATGFLYATNVIPTTKELVDLDIDFEQYLKENKNVCSRYTYRKVARMDSGLKYLDKECLNADQAYVYVLAGGDVYTEDYDVAKIAASKYPGGCFSEIDKDKPNYFYHFHLGVPGTEDQKRKTYGGHIFYGTSPDGGTPV